MGYRDRSMALSISQAVTASAISTNTVDMRVAAPGLELGTGAAVIITCETAPGGTTGINFIVVSHSSAPTDGTYEIARMRVPTADITRGKTFVIPLPRGVNAVKRHIGLFYNLINGNETSGVFSAHIVPMVASG